MSKPFDPSKPVQTRDGRKARIIAADIFGRPHALVALVNNGKMEETLTYFTDGRYYSSEDSPLDLVNIPEKVERWINVNRSLATPTGTSVGGIYFTEAEANRLAQLNRIACIKVEWEEE